MKVLVIGGGLIGVTSAYFLRRDGHNVTVIERAAGPGRETTFANAALLTLGMADPWNAPDSWRVLLSSLARSDATMQLRLRALPALAGWGIRYLRNSSVEAIERNGQSNLRLAQYSLRVMQLLRDQTQIEYGRATRGSLKLFRNRSKLEAASEASARRSEEGIKSKRLSPDETVNLEPALEPIVDQLAGAIHFPSDEVGDAYQFCVALADCAKRLGVEFHFNTEATALERSGARVSAVICGGERFVADQYLVAAGSYSAPLLRRVGLSVPVRPVKGYSVTFDVPRVQRSLNIPVIDDDWHAAVVPLEDAIRVAGTVEFAGYDLTISHARISNLLKFLRTVLPILRFDLATARPWCGLRPMSIDGVPIVGPSSISNLWINTGHGHLGWTMAAGSGQLLAALMSGKTPNIDPSPYAHSRF